MQDSKHTSQSSADCSKPSEEGFLETFAPDKGELYVAERLERMYTGTAPTLRGMRDAYGDSLVNAWLGEQIAYMFEHTESAIDQNKANSLIRLIRAKYPWMKATEFMHFVFLFRTGEFGKVYGKADGQTVMLALKDYCRIRESILEAARAKAEPRHDAPRWAGGHEASARLMEALSAAKASRYGSWRSEPWAECLCKWFFLQALPSIRLSAAEPFQAASEEERMFPGNWQPQQRRQFAEQLGWREG